MSDRLDYEELVEQIKDLPMTYYPAFIYEVIKAARLKGVFVNRNPIPFLEKTCEQILFDELEGK